LTAGEPGLRGVVQHAAQRVDQPRAGSTGRPVDPGFLAEDRAVRPGRADHRLDDLFGLMSTSVAKSVPDFAYRVSGTP
jgi:hypothetical protein